MIVLLTTSIVILSILGMGLLSIAYSVRHNSIKMQNESASMMAAEAGYEKMIFWMGQQQGEYRYQFRDAVPQQPVLEFLRNAGSYRRVRTQQVDFL